MSGAKIQVGIVGMGHIARNRHLPAIHAHGDDVAIRAICDADPARLESEVVCTAVFKFAGGAIAELFCNWGAFRSPPATWTPVSR